jgi:transaldolase
MQDADYLRWLGRETPTCWWHDSGDPEELRHGLEQGAVGVTTNPVLNYQALSARPDHWRAAVQAIPADVRGEARAEAVMRVVVTEAAAKMLPVFVQTQGKQGYVCAQVNPAKAGDRDAMLAQARRYRVWAPNIAVKLPATAAGLDVLEACAAEGITTAVTVGFTVPQAVAAAERFRRALQRARMAGKPLCHCFPVVMIGRLDDYLRDIALDCRAPVSESDIRQAGLAVVKRAYQIYCEQGYEAVIIVAALRGTYHMTELAGAGLIMSVHPSVQAKLSAPDVPREQHIDVPVAPDVIRRLQTIPDFVRAYEPDGMTAEEFMGFGVTQRTLAQFVEAGWRPLESLTIA